MAFDYKRSIIKVQGGQQYLPVSARIVWFREEHPDWSILTEPVEINHEKQFAVFKTTICDKDGRAISTSHKKEDQKGFGDWLEKAETGSVGRALALCGYGTQFAPELNETSRGRYADSPQPVGGNRPDNSGQSGREQDVYQNGRGQNGRVDGGREDDRAGMGAQRNNASRADTPGGNDRQDAPAVVREPQNAAPVQAQTPPANMREARDQIAAVTPANRPAPASQPAEPVTDIKKDLQSDIREIGPGIIKERSRIWGHLPNKADQASAYKTWLNGSFSVTTIHDLDMDKQREVLDSLQALPAPGQGESLADEEKAGHDPFADQ